MTTHETERPTDDEITTALKTLDRHVNHYAAEYAVPHIYDRDGAGRVLDQLIHVRDVLKRLAAVTTTALALVAIPTFSHPVYPPDDYLSGCTITAYDDGSRYAECPEDGAVLAYDADGQRYVNESGAPIHGAGWYVLE